MTRSPEEVGSIIRSLATHHNHGAGWRWTRFTGDLLHIRFRSDFTGYYHWTKRWSRGLDWKHLSGRDSLSKALGLHGSTKGKPVLKRLQNVYYTALAWFRVSVRKHTNMPDGTINGNPIFWEEDGEYIEVVGPTVGEKIADFLEQDPTNPHAIAIATEIQRIWALPRKES